MRTVCVLAALIALAVGCQDAGTSDAASGGTADAAPSGTYRAVFVVTEGGMTDTLAVVEGTLAAPLAAEDMVPVALPTHPGTVRVANTQWPLPAGLDTSAFLLSYREPSGDRVVYATDFSTPRFCTVDTSNADVRAVALAPMWASEAASHPLTVFDGVAPFDTLASFTVTRPSGDAHVTPLDVTTAAGRQSVSVSLETRWADGRARPVVLAFRGVSDGAWWASALGRDTGTAPAAGVQHDHGSFSVNAERPEAFLVALPE